MFVYYHGEGFCYNGSCGKVMFSQAYVSHFVHRGFRCHFLSGPMLLLGVWCHFPLWEGVCLQEGVFLRDGWLIWKSWKVESCLLEKWPNGVGLQFESGLLLWPGVPQHWHLLVVTKVVGTHPTGMYSCYKINSALSAVASTFATYPCLSQSFVTMK